MKRHSYVVILFVSSILFFPFKWETMSFRRDNVEKVKEDYKKIDISDGVNKDEALIIGKYFIATHQDLDVTENVKIKTAEVDQSGLNDDWWAVGFDTSFKFKRRGLQWYTVNIDKNTGEIKARGFGPV